MTKRFDVVAVGDINVDLILSGVAGMPSAGREVLAEGRKLLLGGSTANFACCCARLGLKTAILGKVGGDPMGKLCLESLRKCGVNAAAVRIAPDEQTGITVSVSGADRGFITHLGTNGTFGRRDVDMGTLRAARHVHLGGFFLTQALRPDARWVLQTARNAGATTSLDTGWDPDDQWVGVKDALKAVDVFLPNEAEAERITGKSDPSEALRALGRLSRRAVLKLGPKGAVAWGETGMARVVGFKVKVVDTTGAGDCFNAGVLCGLLRGWPMAKTLRFANACGALCVSRMGGGENAPGLGEVKKFLARNG